MRIEYKILWLDDQIDAFIDDEHVADITQYLEGEGFIPILDTVQNSSDFFDKLDDSYDLILTDYHMKDMNGDEVVEKVREKSVFTEILFYTARADLKDTQKLDRISFFETGSSGSDHEEAVVERTKKLIELTIRKFHDIVVMRGLIMQETSDLDALQLDILKKFVDGKPNTETDELKNEISDKINSHFTRKIKFVNKECKPKKNGFQKLMKDSFVFSSEYRMQTLSKVLEELELDDFSTSYKEEVINVRNKFAHATLEEEKDTDGKVRKYFKYQDEGITFDADYCKKIRLNMRKHKKNIEGLEDKFKK